MANGGQDGDIPRGGSGGGAGARGGGGGGGGEHGGLTDGDGQHSEVRTSIGQEIDGGNIRTTDDRQPNTRGWAGKTRRRGHYRAVLTDGNGVTKKQRRHAQCGRS